MNARNNRAYIKCRKVTDTLTPRHPKRKNGRKKTLKKLVAEQAKKVDGLSRKDIENVRKACRKVWHWSTPHRLVVKRCLLPNGFSKCEGCKKRCPRVYVDHIEAVGDVDAGFILRLFCPSSELQGLCKPCHDAKTKEERKAARIRSKNELDFF